MRKEKISDAVLYYYRKANDKKNSLYLTIFRNDEELKKWINKHDNIDEYDCVYEDIIIEKGFNELYKEVKVKKEFID